MGDWEDTGRRLIKSLQTLETGDIYLFPPHFRGAVITLYIPAQNNYRGVTDKFMYISGIFRGFQSCNDFVNLGRVVAWSSHLSRSLLPPLGPPPLLGESCHLKRVYCYCAASVVRFRYKRFLLHYVRPCGVCHATCNPTSRGGGAEPRRNKNTCLYFSPRRP